MSILLKQREKREENKEGTEETLILNVIEHENNTKEM